MGSKSESCIISGIQFYWPHITLTWMTFPISGFPKTTPATSRMARLALVCRSATTSSVVRLFVKLLGVVCCRCCRMRIARWVFSTIPKMQLSIWWRQRWLWQKMILIHQKNIFSFIAYFQASAGHSAQQVGSRFFFSKSGQVLKKRRRSCLGLPKISGNSWHFG